MWVVGASCDAEAKALITPLQNDVLALPLILAAIRLVKENKVVMDSCRRGRGGCVSEALIVASVSTTPLPAVTTYTLVRISSK